MPELRVTAVIFDMDGVIIDSGGIYAHHWRTWGAAHGLDYETHIASVHPGRPPLETIRIVAPHLDAAVEMATFNASLDADGGNAGVRAMPGAVGLLQALPAGRWAIATSAFRGIARRWLSAAGVPEPGALVTVDDIEHGKPAPDPYLRAAQLLDVDPSRCLVVEDAPAGISAGKAAGATVLALRTTHGPADLGQADGQTLGLETVSASVDGQDLVISWRVPPD